MDLKGVVFDLDHTLFDRYKTIEAVAEFFYNKLGSNICDNVTLEQFTTKFIEVDKKYILFGWPKVFATLQDMKILKPNADFECYSNSLRAAFGTDAIPLDYTIDVLKYINAKGLKCALITNGKRDLQYFKIRKIGIEDYMDEIILAGTDTAYKPDTEPFEKMAQKLGVECENLLYVGDNPINDVDASRNAGYVPVWVKTYGVWVDGIEKCNYQINNVGELPSLIEQLLTQR